MKIHIYFLNGLIVRLIRLTRNIVKIFFIFFDEINRFRRCSIFLSEVFFDKTFRRNFSDDDKKNFVNDDRKDDS